MKFSNPAGPKRLATLFIAIAMMAMTACAGTEASSTGDGDGEAGGQSGSSDDGSASPEEAAAESDVGTAEPAPVTLTAVTAFGEDNVEQLLGWQAVVEGLEEAAPWVTIDYRGGPEAIPNDQQAAAVSDGAVDIVVTPPAYYSNLGPRVLATNISPYTPEEERANGALDIEREWTADFLNAYVLGRAGGGEPFKFWFREPLTEIDFSGLTIRSSSLNVPIVEALGGTAVQLPPGEVYTALERGVVDGLVYTDSADVSRYGWDEIVRYELNIPFMQAFRDIVINMDTWNSLDERTKQAIEQTVADHEMSSREETLRRTAEGRDARVEGGMTLLEFSEQERDAFIDLVYDSTWEYILEQDPQAAEMKEVYDRSDRRVPDMGPLDG